MGQSLKKGTASRARRAGVLDKRFQDNLRILRKARGLKQRELAEAMGCASPNYVSQLETGIRGFSPELVEQLAAFFKVDPGEFFLPGVKRATLRSIFEVLPEECFADLRGTGKCEELVEKFKLIATKELKSSAN
ncbi:MAG TPA: helix-turn-helix transcriptional regulator [Thermodesulfobacteriota bacterium]|nr:helix-turn-helix transcriptional regulator [Thermodesulfobacteriota bacterium]